MPQRRALFASSTGGHLEEMLRLAPRFTPAFDSVVWATFDDPQSRSLLADAEVAFVDLIPPRGLREATQAMGPALRLLRAHGITDVVSAGAAIALPFLLAARMTGVRAHYVESAARTTGPSMTGKLVSRIPGVHLYSQYPSWARGPWRHAGSIFDHLDVTERPEGARPVDRAVVTLGTMRGYPFTRAVEAAERVLSEVGSPSREVLWQVGDSVGEVTGGPRHDLMPATELAAAIEEADLVIAHAGVGSSLRILESGRTPALLYRQARHGEHVDDHQLLIATELERLGLAVSRDPEVFTAPDAVWAMSRTVRARPVDEPFELLTARPGARPAPLPR